MFPIIHASLALLDLLSILRGSDCLAIVGTEGLADIDPDYYLKAAAKAALDGALVPLPHELPRPA
jgi:hypothetical protein